MTGSGTVVREVQETAYAKLNLGLDVTGRRQDGYHLVRMVMQTIGIYDTLVVKAGGFPEDGVIQNKLITGSGAVPADQSNLAMKAAAVMQERFGIREQAEIRLEKRIPVAAGMAGGSADAAAVMRAMRRLFLPAVPMQALEEPACSIGADVPYCLYGGTVLAEGIGEKLSFLPAAPDCPLVVVKPPASVSTPEVYRLYDSEPDPGHADIDGIIRCIRTGCREEMAACFGNVLEKVTAGICREVGELERFLEGQGAVRAMMTGSGPTVFAVFRTAEEAADCAAAVREHPVFGGYEIFATGFVQGIRPESSQEEGI